MISVKKAMKIIGYLLFSMFVVVSISGVIFKLYSDNTIEGQIYQADKDCPIPIGNGVGRIKSIKLENKFITYHVDFNRGYVDIASIRKAPDAFKSMMFLSFVMLRGQSGQVNRWMDDFISKGYGIRFVITEENKNKVTLELTPEYIARMKREVSLNPSEALHEALELKIAMETAGLPMQIDEGLIMTGMKLEGNNIVVYIRISEDMYDLDVLQESCSEAAAILLHEANAGDPELGALFDLCKVSHSGLIYRYIGSRSNRHIDMSLSSQQIRTGRKTPAQVNIR